MDLMAMIDPMMTSAWLYPAVFVLTTLDGFLPMIPGEAVVLTAGVFAAASGAPNLPLVIVSAAAGVWVGDHIAYALGRSVLGSKLVMRSRRLRQAAAAAGRQLDRRGGGLIVTSRFIPGGRYTMNVVSGMTRFPLARFSPAAGQVGRGGGRSGGRAELCDVRSAVTAPSDEPRASEGAVPPVSRGRVRCSARR
jgi:membrane-associated protein